METLLRQYLAMRRCLLRQNDFRPTECVVTQVVKPISYRSFATTGNVINDDIRIEMIIEAVIDALKFVE